MYPNKHRGKLFHVANFSLRLALVFLLLALVVFTIRNLDPADSKWKLSAVSSQGEIKIVRNLNYDECIDLANGSTSITFQAGCSPE